MWGWLRQVALDGYSNAGSPASWKEHIVLVLPLPRKYGTKEGVTDHWWCGVALLEDSSSWKC